MGWTTKPRAFTCPVACAPFATCATDERPPAYTAGGRSAIHVSMRDHGTCGERMVSPHAHGSRAGGGTHAQRGVPPRANYLGASVTALLFLLISLASGWISEKTARLSVVYGSLTAALVFPLLRVSLLLCAAPRCGGSRSLVAAADRGWRTDPHPSETGRAGALRQA
jgi:hypothetical protein